LAVSKASIPIAGPVPETSQTAESSSPANKVASETAPPAMAKTSSEAKRVSFDCKPDNIEPEAEIFHTPAGSPQRTVPQAPEGVVSSASASPQLPSVPSIPSFPPPVSVAQPSDQATPSPAPTFSLILRRADNVPLGLDVRGDENETCLVVESVRAGGAVEAWNKQCPDNARAIKAGDRIVKINDAEDADSMRDQCINKYLLRISVTRGGSLASQQAGSLRAEANEFVPRVQSSC